jgi:hypothetical protein
MFAIAWITCLWPGLPRLWWRGEWRALLGASAFAAVLNLGLVSGLLWRQSLPGWLLVAGWSAIGLIWLVCAWHGWWMLPKLRGGNSSPEKEGLFVRAQQEYLNRHWLEAEELLAELLACRDQDAEARLMLATLYRHTKRFAEADECLTRLERMDSGDRWCLEAGRERRLLKDLVAPTIPPAAEGCEDDFKDSFFTDEGMDGKAVAGARRVA